MNRVELYYPCGHTLIINDKEDDRKMLMNEIEFIYKTKYKFDIIQFDVFEKNLDCKSIFEQNLIINTNDKKCQDKRLIVCKNEHQSHVKTPLFSLVLNGEFGKNTFVLAWADSIINVPMYIEKQFIRYYVQLPHIIPEIYRPNFFQNIQSLTSDKLSCANIEEICFNMITTYNTNNGIDVENPQHNHPSRTLYAVILNFTLCALYYDDNVMNNSEYNIINPYVCHIDNDVQRCMRASDRLSEFIKNVSAYRIPRDNDNYKDIKRIFDINAINAIKMFF